MRSGRPVITQPVGLTSRQQGVPAARFGNWPNLAASAGPVISGPAGGGVRARVQSPFALRETTSASAAPLALMLAAEPISIGGWFIANLDAANIHPAHFDAAHLDAAHPGDRQSLNESVQRGLVNCRSHQSDRGFCHRRKTFHFHKGIKGHHPRYPKLIDGGSQSTPLLGSAR